MKILLDTSYFLSAYKLKSYSLPVNVLKEIKKRHHEFYYSDFVYFECNAKASKFNCANLNMITTSIITSPDFIELHSKSQPIWELACYFRKYHTDFIDCIHYATAIYNQMDYFLTEETEFRRLVGLQISDFTTTFGQSYTLPPFLNFSEFIKTFPEN